MGTFDFTGLSVSLSRKRLELYPHTKEVLEDMKTARLPDHPLFNAQADFTNPEIDLVGLRAFPCHLLVIWCRYQTSARVSLGSDKRTPVEPEQNGHGGEWLYNRHVAQSIRDGISSVNTLPYSDAELWEESSRCARIRDIPRIGKIENIIHVRGGKGASFLKILQSKQDLSNFPFMVYYES